MSKKLGQLVKDARTQKGISQTALAQTVDGLTAADIGKIERGEKEPTQAILKQLAKALGVTQKSLLDAATGTSSGSTAKKPAGKTASAGKTTGKTASKKTSDKTSVSALTLTATEKKLVQQYRKADSAAKKAAMNLLSGNGNILEILPVLMSDKSGSSSSGSGGASDLLGTLLSGKTGSSSSGNGELLNTLMNALGKK